MSPTRPIIPKFWIPLVYAAIMASFGKIPIRGRLQIGGVALVFSQLFFYLPGSRSYPHLRAATRRLPQASAAFRPHFRPFSQTSRFGPRIAVYKNRDTVSLVGTRRCRVRFQPGTSLASINQQLLTINQPWPLKTRN